MQWWLLLLAATLSAPLPAGVRCRFCSLLAWQPLCGGACAAVLRPTSRTFLSQRFLLTWPLLLSSASATVLPSGTGLSLQLANGQEYEAAEGSSLSPIIGEGVSALIVVLPPGYGFDLRPSRLKVVAGSIARGDAQTGLCLTAPAADENDVELPLSATQGAPTVLLSGGVRLSTALGSAVHFWTAGHFQVCYSDDGSFTAGHADVVNVVLDVQGFVRPRLAAGTGLQVTLAMGMDVSAMEGEVLSLSAGEPMENVSVLAPEFSTFNVTHARLRVLAAPSSGMHTNGSVCSATLWDVGAEVIDTPLHSPTGARTERAPSSRTLALVLAGNASFREAGRYQICYSDDGSFQPEHVDIVRVVVEVEGAMTSCSGDRCMALRTFNCYSLLSKDSLLSNCSVSVDGMRGGLGRVSWSSSFAVTYGGDGLPLSLVDAAPCGSLPVSGFLCPWPQLCQSGDLNDTAAVMSAEVLRLPPRVGLQQPHPTAAAVCYCSGLRGCTDYSSYSQQVGILYLFVAAATLHTDRLCANAWSGIIASSLFSICVHCPPGACPYDDESSRLQLAVGLQTAEMPAWADGHYCRTASSSPDLLPQNSTHHSSGGPRSDFKRFEPVDAPGFSLPHWPDFHPPGTLLDICFCIADCGMAGGAGWFKAGELAVIGPRLIAGAATGAVERTPPHLVRLQGQLALEGSLLALGYAPDVLGLGVGGMARVATFSQGTDSNLSAACNRAARTQVADDVLVDVAAGSAREDRFVFDGGVLGAGRLALSYSNVYAVCYCALYNVSACLEPEWAVVGALSLPGPRFGQVWELPTFRILRFEYLGNDLRDGDLLRFIPQADSCDTDPSPAAMEICPQSDVVGGHDICGASGIPALAEYRTATMANNRVQCNELNQGCQAAPLVAVEAQSSGLQIRLGASTSSPSGLGDLGLRDGDTIVLGAGVECGERCTPEVLQQARGVQSFPGLQLYLDFEEGQSAALQAAGRVADRVGDRSFTLAGEVSWDSPGFKGTSLRLAVGAAARLDDSVPRDGLDLTRGWSWMAWINAENATWQTLWALADDSGTLDSGELEIGLGGPPWTPGSLFLQQEGVVGGEAPGMDGKTVPDGLWSHVAVVYTGTMTAELRFYVGGTLVYTRSGVRLQTASRSIVCGGGALDDVVGGRVRGDGSLALDEVRWYNRALTTSDVVAIANLADPTVDTEVEPHAVLGNMITQVSSDGLSLIVPGLTWRTEPTFTVGAGSTWRRSSRGVTAAEVVTPNAQTVKVCWGRGDVFTEAGQIHFQPPARLLDVGVYATSTEWDKASPFVVSFRLTGETGSAAQAYANAQNSLTLEFVILNRNRFDITSSTINGVEMSSARPGDDELGRETQAFCGQLFRELWSDDTEMGFPLPKGCFQKTLASSMRQLVVVFEPRNFLRGGKTYQLVMNGKATNFFDVNREVILIQTGDDVHNRRYSSIHIGHGFFDKAYELGAGKVDPQFTALDIMDGDAATKLHELQKPGHITLWMQGGLQQLAGIRRGNFLTFWFWPLTAWQLESSCADVSDTSAFADSMRVRCTVVRGTSKRCGVIELCLGKPVVPNMNVNSVLLQLPPRMSDLFGTLVFQLQLSNILLPSQGVLPHHFGAEVKRDDGTKPNYFHASGPYLYVPVARQAVLGRLLTNGEESIPFQGSAAHLLYVKLILPTTLRGADFTQPEPAVRPAAEFTIMAPEGFALLDVTAAPPAGLGNPVLTKSGEAVSGLNVSEQMPAPTGYGTPQLSGWRIDGRNCTYTLPDFTLIPAGTSIVVGFMLRPTNSSLPISDPANLWQVEVTAPGDHNMTRVQYYEGFYRTGVGGVPVLGVVQNTLIQPSNMAVSDPSASVVQWLYIFFRNEVNVTAGGSINVLGPDVFDFGEVCNAEDLDGAHYATGPPLVLQRLPVILRCEGVCSSGNCGGLWPTGSVTFEGPLAAGWTYGFRIRVTNPAASALATYAAAAESRGETPDWSWNLRTQGPLGDAVAVSPEPVQAFPGLEGSWVLRNVTLPAWPSLDAALAQDSPGAAVSLSSLLPYTIEGQATIATVVLMLPVNITGRLYVAAPPGYNWLKDLVQGRPGDPWNVPAFLDLPGNVEVFASVDTNVLVFHSGTFFSNFLYGLNAPIYVPDFSPVDSFHAFTLQLVPDRITQDVGMGVSAVLPAGPVRSLVDAYVRAAHRLPGIHTDLMIQVRLATPIDNGGMLQIRAPPGFQAASHCQLRPWPGAEAWVNTGNHLRYAQCLWLQDVSLLQGAVVHVNGSAAFVQETFVAAGLPWREEFSALLGGRYRVQNASAGEVGLPAPDGSIWVFPAAAVHREPSGLLRILPINGFPLPSGLLQLRISVQNPAAPAADAEADVVGETRCGAPLCWGFQSLDLAGNPLDAPQELAGLDVAVEMAEAGLLVDFRPDGRDDRPLQPSRLALRFRLEPVAGSSRQLPPGMLLLTAPAGFRFNNRCLSDVEIRTVTIFGEGPNPLQRWAIDVWERSAVVVSCEGTGETASVMLASGLYANRAYAFVIAVQNAERTPTINNWTISFQGYFSRPFPSFEIWTFSNVSVSPLSAHAAAQCNNNGVCNGAAAGLAVPLILQFRPYQPIQTDGYLWINMPPDFGFPPTEGAALIGGDRPTECIVWEYDPQNMSAEPMVWPLKDRDCLIVDKGNTLDGSGTGDRRTLRVIPRYQFNAVDPTPPLSLAPDHIYRLLLYVEPPVGFRPAIDWELESRSAAGELLDRGSVPGYDVQPVLRGFLHTNVDGYNSYANRIVSTITGGLSPIPDLIFELVFTENLWPADRVVLAGPPLFELQRPSMPPDSPGSCIGLRVVSPVEMSTLVPPVEELARCNQEVLSLSMRNMNGPMYAGTSLKLLLELSNPNKPIPAERNYWLAEHRSGVADGLIASAIALSWAVVPRLLDTSVFAFGALKAVGAETTLYFRFRNVQVASEVDIEALEPAGFGFEGAFAVAWVSGQRVVPQVLLAEGSRLRLVMFLGEDDSVVMTVDSVTLPLQNGTTQWRVSTSSLAEDGTGTLLKDSANFSGFVVSGRITVSQVDATTDGQPDAILGQDDAMLQMHLQSTVSLEPGDVLRVGLSGAGNLGFHLYPLSAQLRKREDDQLVAEWLCVRAPPGVGPGPDQPGPDCTTGFAEGSVFFNASTAVYFSDVDSQSPMRLLPLLLDAHVGAGQALVLHLRVMTPTNRTEFVLESWNISAFRDASTANTTLISTNDALPLPLVVVTLLPPEPLPVAPHRPPAAVVQVLLVLDPLDTGAAAFVVTLPETFGGFPRVCSDPLHNNVTDFRCRALGAPALAAGALPPPPGEGEGYRRARLDCGQGAGVECMRRELVVVLVEMPRATPPPAQNFWFVEAVEEATPPPTGMEVAVGGMLGRKELPGFDLVPMPAATVYSSSPSVPIDVGISFVSRVPLPHLGTIYIAAPPSLTSFGCGSVSRGGVEPVSPMSVLRCEDAGIGTQLFVRLTINGTLPPGRHGLVVPATTAPNTPNDAENVFEVFLRDAEGRNLDVAVDVPGEPLLPGLRASVWTLWWQPVPAPAPSRVTLPVELVNDADVPVHGILVDLPPTMELHSDEDVVVSVAYGEDNLPQVGTVRLSAGRGSFLIRLDGARRIARGTYLVRFNVLTPERAPAFNLWRLAFCGEVMARAEENCTLGESLREGRGSAVLSVFAVAGHDPASVPGETLPAVAGTARMRHVAMRGLALAIALLSLARRPP